MIYVKGTIGEDATAGGLRSQIRDADPGAATCCWFDSTGGSWMEAKAMRSVLHSRKGTIAIIRQAASAAAFVALGCTHRMMQRGGTMMIHKARFPEGYEPSQHGLKILERENAYLAVSLSNRSKLSLAEVDRLLEVETHFSDREAVAFGLADRVLGDGQPVSREKLLAKATPMRQARPAILAPRSCPRCGSELELPGFWRANPQNDGLDRRACRKCSKERAAARFGGLYGPEIHPGLQLTR